MSHNIMDQQRVFKDSLMSEWEKVSERNKTVSAEFSCFPALRSTSASHTVCCGNVLMINCVCPKQNNLLDMFKNPTSQERETTSEGASESVDSDRGEFHELRQQIFYLRYRRQHIGRSIPRLYCISTAKLRSFYSETQTRISYSCQTSCVWVKNVNRLGRCTGGNSGTVHVSCLTDVLSLRNIICKPSFTLGNRRNYFKRNIDILI